ncbi:hypothetical protein WR25_03508 [Diploscapter pachys]|uniref:Uncharacterized protein n=1 Tax=Diploscapter pachys TaxID=2018661 RepID=A0A2A2JCL2_9BILA|nr:hypothetical protein WR25_03508 [Diploscapter pachys]
MQPHGTTDNDDTQSPIRFKYNNINHYDAIVEIASVTQHLRRANALHRRIDSDFNSGKTVDDERVPAADSGMRACVIVWREVVFVYLLVVLPGYPARDN